MKNQQGSILLILLIILLVAAGIYGYILLSKNNSQNLINQVKNVIMNQPTGGKEETTPSARAQITITKDGFLPATLTVAKNQQVTFINNDNSNHHIISPEQLDLDSDILNPNDSYIFTFEKTGTYTYTDKLNPNKFKGTVIVK